MTAFKIGSGDEEVAALPSDGERRSIISPDLVLKKSDALPALSSFVLTLIDTGVGISMV